MILYAHHSVRTTLKPKVPNLMQVYEQLYSAGYSFWGGGSALNYTSPLLHTAVMRGLAPNTT